MRIQADTREELENAAEDHKLQGWAVAQSGRNPDGSWYADLQTPWQPIKTAPRNGSLVRLKADKVSSFIWRWDHTNDHWASRDYLMTWRDGETGPTHWRPASK